MGERHRAEGPARVGRGPDGDERGGQQRQARSCRREAHGGPEQERKQRRQRRTRRIGNCRRLASAYGKDEHRCGDERDGENSRLGTPAKRDGSDRILERADDRQDGWRDGKLAENVGEESCVPDDPIGLASKCGHGGGIRERGQKRRNQHRSADEDDDAAKRIQARGSIAEAAHAHGGKKRLAAVGDEQRQHERRGPASRHLRGNVCRESREQIDPPTTRRGQE